MLPASADDSSSDKLDEITEEKVIEILEFLYPNPVTIQYLVRYELNHKGHFKCKLTF